MGRPFKNWRCGASVPESGGWMNPDLRRGCIRRDGHDGPHRTRFAEWDRGAKSLNDLRKREFPDHA